MATRTWDGGGTGNNASTKNNWSDNTLPINGDTVVFDATSTDDCTWDLAITGITFQMNSGYTGTVTLDNDVDWDSATIDAGTLENGAHALVVQNAVVVGATLGSATSSGAWTFGSLTVNNGATVNVTSGNMTLNGNLTLNDSCTWTKDGTIIVNAGLTIADNNATAQDLGPVQINGAQLTLDSSDATPEVKISTLARSGASTGNSVVATGSIQITVTGVTFETSTGFNASTWNTSVVRFETSGAAPNTLADNPLYKIEVATGIQLNIPSTRNVYVTNIEVEDSASIVSGPPFISARLTIQNTASAADPVITLGTGSSITARYISVEGAVDMDLAALTVAAVVNATIGPIANDVTMALAGNFVLTAADLYVQPDPGVTGSKVALAGNALALAADLYVGPTGAADAITLDAYDGEITDENGAVYKDTVTVSNDGTVFVMPKEFQADVVQSGGGVARRAEYDVRPSVYQNPLGATA